MKRPTCPIASFVGTAWQGARLASRRDGCHLAGNKESFTRRELILPKPRELEEDPSSRCEQCGRHVDSRWRDPEQGTQPRDARPSALHSSEL